MESEWTETEYHAAMDEMASAQEESVSSEPPEEIPPPDLGPTYSSLADEILAAAVKGDEPSASEAAEETPSQWARENPPIDAVPVDDTDDFDDEDDADDAPTREATPRERKRAAKKLALMFGAALKFMGAEALKKGIPAIPDIFVDTLIVPSTIRALMKSKMALISDDTMDMVVVVGGSVWQIGCYAYSFTADGQVTVGYAPQSAQHPGPPAESPNHPTAASTAVASAPAANPEPTTRVGAMIAQSRALLKVQR